MRPKPSQHWTIEFSLAAKFDLPTIQTPKMLATKTLGSRDTSEIIALLASGMTVQLLE
jgi:hypothetical protein